MQNQINRDNGLRGILDPLADQFASLSGGTRAGLQNPTLQNGRTPEEVLFIAQLGLQVGSQRAKNYVVDNDLFPRVAAPQSNALSRRPWPSQNGNSHYNAKNPYRTPYGPQS